MTFFCSSTFYNAIVSLDGKEDYVNIGAAIAATSNNSNSRFNIHVKPGVYYEYIKVELSQTFIILAGDDASTMMVVGTG